MFVPVTHGDGEDQNLTMTYTLDKLGRQVMMTDAIGNQTSMTYRKDGQVVATTDAIGMVTQLAYDRLHRGTMVVQNYQGNGEDPSLWVWDASDQRWEKSTGSAIAHGTNRDQNIIVRVSFDKAGRTLNQRDPRGNLTTYSYDLLDRRLTLTNPLSKTWETAYEEVYASGTPTGATRMVMTYPGLGSGPYDVTRAFDRVGRLATVAYDQLGITPDVSYSYDAASRRVKMTERGTGNTTVRETNFGYDGANRLTSVGFDNDGGGTVDETVSYSYDASGRRTKLTLPGGLEVTYSYDGKGQLVSLTDWDNQTTGFGYDGIGRMRLTERANGLRSQYGYDAGGRLTRLWHTAQRRTFADFAYTVDARGNRIRALELLAQSGTGSTTIDKDNESVTLVRGTWADSGSFKVSNNISAALRIIFSGDELMLTVGMGPDHSQYDIYIDSSYWDTVDGYAASASELALSIQLSGDGVHTLEIRNRAARHALSSGHAVRFKQLQTNRAYSLKTLVYEYDGLARLLSSTHHPNDNLLTTPKRVEAFTFDLAGNRTSESVTINGGMPTVTNTPYNAANQISTSGFAFDPNGNMTSDGTNTYVWDRANRLLSVGNSAYSYDGEGRRITQTVSSVLTTYLMDVQPGLAQVISATTGANTERYVHGLSGIHAQKDAANNWEWMLQDGLGSVRGMTDNANAVLWSGSYDSFGNGLDATGTPQTTFGFTGEQYDAASDLLYLRARHYKPGLGTFTSLDPFEGLMARPMSRNGYSWVEGNVVNFTDPSGNQACSFGYMPNPDANGADCIPMMSSTAQIVADYSINCNSQTNLGLLLPPGNIDILPPAFFNDANRLCGALCNRDHKDYIINRFSSAQSECRQRANEICDKLCNVQTRQMDSEVGHFGILRRWADYYVDILGQRGNHTRPYQEIQRELRDILNNNDYFDGWNSSRNNCGETNKYTTEFQELATKWATKPLEIPSNQIVIGNQPLIPQVGTSAMQPGIIVLFGVLVIIVGITIVSPIPGDEALAFTLALGLVP